MSNNACQLSNTSSVGHTESQNLLVSILADDRPVTIAQPINSVTRTDLFIGRYQFIGHFCPSSA